MRTFCTLLLSLLWTSQALAAEAVCANAAKVVPEKSLLITDLAVVDAPEAQGEGTLSLQRVFKSIFPQGTDLSAAVERWFTEWSEPEALGRAVHPREQGLLLGLWPRTATGALDLSQPPFHLLSIVYRPDLVTAAEPYGEGRFVFGAFNPRDGSAIELTVIFEFALPPADHPAAWAEDFAALSASPFGADYNRRLEAIANKILNASPSALAQVRTNDFFLGPDWELREFHMSPEGELKLALTLQTPDLSYDSSIDASGSNDFTDWVLANGDAIEQDHYEIPSRFLAVGSVIFDDHFKWFENQPQIPEVVRHRLSMNTCNGCHGGETHTRFLHISPRRAGMAPDVSTFLRNQLPLRLKVMQDLICGGKTS